MFVGFHELSLDDKNRISIPSSFRSQMVSETEGVRFYLAPGERDNTLELFPEDYYPAYVKELQASLGRSEDAKDFRTFFLSMSALLDVDKQGRVLLPQQHLQYAGIGKHLLLTGDGERLVMWNRESGRKFIEQGWATYRKLKQVAELKNGGNNSAGPKGQDQ